MANRNNKTSGKDYTKDEVMNAVTNSYGVVSRVADALKCTWATARKYIEMYEDAKSLFSDETERVLDLAETKIIKAINLDDIGTAKWLLANKGKHRGYNQQLEVTGKDGGAIEVKTISIIKTREEIE
jgi:hypothetical protein